MKRMIRRNVMAATSIEDLKLSRSGGTYYFTTYNVYDGHDWIGSLEVHDRGVKETYYVAWHYYKWNGPNHYGNTETFDTEEEALQWILDNRNAGDLRNPENDYMVSM